MNWIKVDGMVFKYGVDTYISIYCSTTGAKLLSHKNNQLLFDDSNIPQSYEFVEVVENKEKLQKKRMVTKARRLKRLTREVFNK